LAATLHAELYHIFQHAFRRFFTPRSPPAIFIDGLRFQLRRRAADYGSPRLMPRAL
jgi:hypothetical protein